MHPASGGSARRHNRSKDGVDCGPGPKDKAFVDKKERWVVGCERARVAKPFAGLQ